MTATVTRDPGGWRDVLVSSSDVARGVGHPADGVPPADDAPPRADANAAVRDGAGLVPGARVAPRFVADAPAKASIAPAHRDAAPCGSKTGGVIRLQAGNARDSGAAATHTRAANAGPMGAGISGGDAVASPTAKALAEEARTRKKLTAKIHLRAPQSRESDTRGAAAATDTAAACVIPPFTGTCAIDVAQHIQGRRSKGAGAYLARVAQQQGKRGEAQLSRLVGMLVGPTPRPGGEGLQLAPGGVRAVGQAVGPASVPDAVLDAARQATEAWLLSGYLIHDARAASGGVEPALVDGLEGNVDRILGHLGPRALLALHARLTADDALTAPSRTGMFSNQMENSVDAVGLLAVRNGWAASTLCDLVGEPLRFGQLYRILSDAAAASRSTADMDSMTNVIKHLAPLATARFQYMLVHFLRIRTAETLRDQGIPVNELIGIARTSTPEADYAASVADALRRTFAPGALAMDGRPARHPPDGNVRRQLSRLLSQFSDAELRAVTGNLFIGTADFAERARSLKQQVENHGVDAADKAALGRQFMGLCATVAQASATRFSGQAGSLAVDRLQAWDWDDRFSRSAPALPRPTVLQRAARAVSRGARRLFFSVFHSYKEDERRMREAYAGAVQAASRFIDAVSANTPSDPGGGIADAPGTATARRSPPAQGHAALRAFDKSAARLMRAARRCHAMGSTPDGDIVRSNLQMPADPVRLLDAAFRDALGATPGARVDAIGRFLSRPEGVNRLLAQHGGTGSTQGAEQGKTHPTLRTQRNGSSPSAGLGAQRFVDRLTAYARGMGRQSVGPADARQLVEHLRTAVKEEAGIRAAMEILRALDLYFANAQATRASTAITGDESSAEDRLLTDIWTLEQRFRPLDGQVFPDLASTRLDWPQLLGMGLQRLPPAQRDRLRDAICDLDRPKPVRLARDELWLAVARCFQDRGGLV